MSAHVRLSFACGDYEIFRPLIDGTVKPDGIDLVTLTDMGSRERHWRMSRNLEFDICELNVGAFLMAKNRGAPIVGLPVFGHRRFRHGFVFVNTKAGIKEPKDLIGKRVGGTNFQPAANLWMRGILEEYYGVPHQSITWVTERSEDVEFTPAKGLKIERAPEGKTIDAMLASGELPAAISPTVLKSFIAGNPNVARLFPNYKEIEQKFYKDTGIFPIMHITAIKEDVLKRDPWVAINLMKAFDLAKHLAYKRAANPRTAPLAWVRDLWEEERRVLGPDPWAYGLTPQNRKNLETIVRYVHGQGLISEAMKLDEIFADVDISDIGPMDEGV